MRIAGEDVEKIGLDPFNFERGIERITRKQDPAAGLPVEGELTPAERPIRPQLEQVLHLAHLDDYLEDWLTPALVDREILLPSRFRTALKRCQTALQTAAQQNPAAARVFHQAARVLAEDERLYGLLAMYRNLLQRG